MDDVIICYHVISITKDEIVIKQHNKKIHIYFDDCAKNFALEKGVEFSKCVASRDITTLSFTFYTTPKIKVVFKRTYKE